MGYERPSNTWLRGPTRAFIQNGMSIGSAVFAQRTVDCRAFYYFTMCYYVSPKLPINQLGEQSTRVTTVLRCWRDTSLLASLVISSLYATVYSGVALLHGVDGVNNDHDHHHDK